MSLLDRPAADTQVTHGQRLWLYVAVGLILAFLVAPTLIVVPMSFSASDYLEFPPREWSLRWYRAYFGSDAWRDATVMSVKVALLTVAAATPLGTAAAYGLHVSRFGWARPIYAVLGLPIMVPLILLAIGLFFVYIRLGLANTVTGLVLAHTMLAIPYVVVMVAAGLKSYDMNQEMVARSLGAGRLTAFLTVTLPQIRVSVVSGALFAFITSFDEVLIAMFVSSGPQSTLTRRMFLSLRDTIDPTIAAISTCLIVLSVLLLGAAQIFGGGRAFIGAQGERKG